MPLGMHSLEPKLEVEPLDGRETAAIGIVGALVDNDDAWQPLVQLGLVWTGGLLGPLAAQSLYHGHALRDGSMTLWLHHRPAVLRLRDR